MDYPLIMPCITSNNLSAFSNSISCSGILMPNVFITLHTEARRLLRPVVGNVIAFFNFTIDSTNDSFVTITCDFPDLASSLPRTRIIFSSNLYCFILHSLDNRLQSVIMVLVCSIVTFSVSMHSLIVLSVFFCCSMRLLNHQLHKQPREPYST